MKYAFRCKECGHLHPAEHAGECDLPHACQVCNGGVGFDPKTGVKKFDVNNWEVLGEAKPERLKELGIDPKQVVKHAGKVRMSTVGPEGDYPGKQVDVVASEGAGVKNKQ